MLLIFADSTYDWLSPSIVVVLLGAVLLLIGVTGGGSVIKEVPIPKVEGAWRVVSLISGVVLLSLGLGFFSPLKHQSTNSSPPPSANIQPSPEPSTTVVKPKEEAVIPANASAPSNTPARAASSVTAERKRGDVAATEKENKLAADKAIEAGVRAATDKAASEAAAKAASEAAAKAAAEAAAKTASDNAAAQAAAKAIVEATSKAKSSVLVLKDIRQRRNGKPGHIEWRFEIVVNGRPLPDVAEHRYEGNEKEIVVGDGQPVSWPSQTLPGPGPYHIEITGIQIGGSLQAIGSANIQDTVGSSAVARVKSSHVDIGGADFYLEFLISH